MLGVHHGHNDQLLTEYLCLLSFLAAKLLMLSKSRIISVCKSVWSKINTCYIAHFIAFFVCHRTLTTLIMESTVLSSILANMKTKTNAKLHFEYICTLLTIST